MYIGENIARLRRKAGLTQEQLGNFLSVSAQAVSKWEKGGMPDTELLPAIADTLHVTIDTLFGRENTESADMEEIFFNWYMRIPEEKRQSELFKLLLLSQNSPIKADREALINEMDALGGLPLRKSSGFYFENGKSIPVWLRSQFMDDYGMRLSIPAEDCPLFLVLPEPEEGFRKSLLEPEMYGKLFSVLAHEESMELLFFFYSEPIQYYSAAALAKACGIDESCLMPAIDAMSEIKLITKRTVIEADGKHSVYALNENPGFVPFLLFARWMMEGLGYVWSWDTRSKPILRKEGSSNERSEKQE